MTDWSHDALANDLAAHLKAPARMVWTNMQLGPSGSPRPDVYTLAKSFVRPCPTAYEVKISRADFRADVTVAKWQAYLEYAHSVVFAVPAGLIDKREVPEMCGLIIRHENSWRIAKKAVINPHPIAQEALLKLLIDGVEREGPVVRARFWNQWDSTRRFAEKFGTTAARYISNIADAERHSEQVTEQAQQIIIRAEKRAQEIIEKARTDMPERWRELLETLKLDSDADAWEVRHAIDRLQQRHNGNGHTKALGDLLKQLQRLVDVHTQRLGQQDAEDL